MVIVKTEKENVTEYGAVSCRIHVPGAGTVGCCAGQALCRRSGKS